MADDSNRWAIKPSLNREQIRRALGRVKKLNHEIWSSPDVLGPDSQLFKKAYAQLQQLLSFQIPDHETEAAILKRATFIAWTACWRARDYTVTRIESELKSAGFTAHQRQNWSRDARLPISSQGLEWPVTHLPLPLLSQQEKKILSQQYLEQHTGHEIERRFTNALSLYSEGVIFNRSPLYKGQIQWSNKATAVWCYFDTPSEKVASPKWCYFSNDEAPTTANITGGVAYSIFECDAKLSGLEDVSQIERSRFTKGLQISDANLIKDHNFPPTIETGPKLSLVGGRIGTSLKFSSLLGLRTLVISGLQDGNIFIRNQQLDTLKLINTNNQNPIALCSVKQCKIGIVQISGNGAERLRIENCQIEDALQADECELHSLHLIKSEFLDTKRSINAYGLQVTGKLSICDCTFAGLVDLTNSKLEDVSFSTSHKDARNVFKSEVVAKSTQGESKHWLGSINIRNSEFLHEVSFENREFRERTAFEDCLFHRVPRFQSSDFNFDTSFRRTKFEWKPYILAATGRKRDDRLSITEGSFRTLAKQMETIKAHDYQSKFHVEQMRARFMRKDGGEIPLHDKLAARVYSLTSGYGSSFVRPLVGLLLLIEVTCAIYLALLSATGATIGWPLATSTALLALTLTFRPFFVYNPVFGRPDIACAPGSENCNSVELAAYLTQNCELPFKLLGTAHSIISTLLIFSFLLALRRKFQLG